MKTLNIFYLAHQNIKNNLQSLINSCLKENGKFKNSLIDFFEQINDCECICLLHSHFSPSPTKIKVCFYELDLDLNQDYVLNFIKEIIVDSIKKASLLSKEPLDIFKSNEIFSKIEGKFNTYFSYKNSLLVPDIECCEPYLSIIDLANEIFCEILVSHLLNNGNKRLATVLLTNFLYSLGYYVKYTRSALTN